MKNLGIMIVASLCLAAGCVMDQPDADDGVDLFEQAGQEARAELQHPDSLEVTSDSAALMRAPEGEDAAFTTQCVPWYMWCSNVLTTPCTPGAYAECWNQHYCEPFGCTCNAGGGRWTCE